MKQTVCQPKCDDKIILDITMGMYAYPTVLVAHRLGIFKYISEESKTLKEICNRFTLAARPANAILSVIRALGLIEYTEKGYSLTRVSKEYLLEERSSEINPNYFGYFWDLMYENSENFSLTNLRAAITNNQPQVYNQDELFTSHLQQPEKAKLFTDAMHALSMGAASIWPDKLKLSTYNTMLDIGGGSGAHTLGVVTRWRHIHGIIYDFPEICKLASKFVKDYDLEKKITTRSGNMWDENTSFPEADIHFYSNIFHDWPEEKNKFLAKKSFKDLSPGGMIILHELLYHDDGSGPLAAAAYSVIMLGWTEGKQYSGAEITRLLDDVGFREIKITPALGYYSVITGIKPK